MAGKVFGCAVLLAGASWGHDLEILTQLVPPAVVIRATYAGTEPVPFAKIQIYSPADPGKEFQSGNLDRRGYFSFVPEGPGAWRVVVDDELGHRKEISVAVPNPFTGGPSNIPTGPSRFERALLGLALIFGVTGFWYGYKRAYRK